MKNRNKNPPLATPPTQTPHKHRDSYREIIKRAKIRAMNVPKLSDIKIKDFEGDMNKEWYVEFYVEIEGKKERHRVKAGLNRIKDRGERYRVAKAMVDELKLHLHMGLFEVVKHIGGGDKVEIKSERAQVAFARVLDFIGPTVEPRTLGAYRTAVNKFLEFYGAGMVHDISQTTIETFRNQLYADNLSDKTIHNTIKNIGRLLKELKLGVNPCEGVVTKNKTTGDASIPWTDTEFHKLKEYTADKLNFRAYWGMIYYCAIRPGEISHLKAKHIDLDSHQIIIPSEAAKNKKTQNVVIPNQFYDTLKDFLMTIPKDYYLFDRHFQPKLDKEHSTHYASGFKKYISNPIKVEKPAYQLKHTAAVHMVRAKIDKTRIQHHLRHASVEETEGYLKSLDRFMFREMETEFPEV